MRSKWILIIVISSVSAVFLIREKSTEITDTRISETKVEPAENKKRLIATTPIAETELDSQNIQSVEPLDSLSNSFVKANQANRNKSKEIFKMIESEKRRKLDIQLVGNSWSEFTDLTVSLETVNDSLFTLGPYKVSRKANSESDSGMKLVYNENQKTMGVLTGRLVITVRDLVDVNPIANDYDLKLENISAEIKTAYLNQTNVERFSNLNSTLKSDGRVERFYFEIVRTDWVRN